MRYGMTFRSYRCVVQRRAYDNGRIALALRDAVSGEPVATATINLPEVALAADEVIVKDYSENEGMLAALLAAGVVGPPRRVIRLRYVPAYVCPCLITE